MNAMADRCPTCGSEQRSFLGPLCDFPEGVDDRHIPADEFADDWHYSDEKAIARDALKVDEHGERGSRDAG